MIGANYIGAPYLADGYDEPGGPITVTGVANIAIGNLSLVTTSQKTVIGHASLPVGSLSLLATSKRTVFGSSVSIVIGPLAVVAHGVEGGGGAPQTGVATLTIEPDHAYGAALYAGTALTLRAVFTNPGSSTPVDPENVAIKWSIVDDADSTVTTATYPDDVSIVRDSTGSYEIVVDTVDAPGHYVFEVEASGGCNVTGVIDAYVLGVPL